MEISKFKIFYFFKIILALCKCICYYNSCCESMYYFRLKISQGGAIMAVCSVCGKGAHFGCNVSHSHRRSNKMWKANIKKVKCNVNGTHKSLYVCTSCLRSNKVERA